MYESDADKAKEAIQSIISKGPTRLMVIVGVIIFILIFLKSLPNITHPLRDTRSALLIPLHIPFNIINKRAILRVCPFYGRFNQR